jgi:Fe-S cluster biogenesis protein NfuA
MDDAAVRERVAHVEELLARIADDAPAVEALRAIVDLYGEGLRRIVEGVGSADPLVDDELVSHLLLLHDLHPVDVETRVVRALDEVRPYLGSHGGGVELLGIADGVVHVRLEGTCNGCPSSAATLRHAIEDAVARAAPELEGVAAEGVAEPRPPSQLLQIGSLQCPTELQSA